MKELDKLDKKQLKELAKDLLHWHEVRYKAVEKGEDIESAYFQLVGHFQAIRKQNNLPPLY